MPDFRPLRAWAGATLLAETEVAIDRPHVWSTQDDIERLRRKIEVLGAGGAHTLTPVGFAEISKPHSCRLRAEYSGGQVRSTARVIASWKVSMKRARFMERCALVMGASFLDIPTDVNGCFPRVKGRIRPGILAFHKRWPDQQCGISLQWLLSGSLV